MGLIGSPAARLSPVLPVLFYTGSETWPDPANLSHLVVPPELLAPYVPPQPVVFLDLCRRDPMGLLQADHPFLWLLAALSRSHGDLSAFLRWFEEAAIRLDGLLASDRERALGYLVFLYLLGQRVARPRDRGVVEETLRGKLTHLRDMEYDLMKDTIEAELLREGKKLGIEEGFRRGIEKGIEKGIARGTLQAQKSTLLRLLRRRFGDLPSGVVDLVTACSESVQLDTWLDRVVTAATLDDVAIRGPGV